MRYDFCVVGGGIVGLATANALLRKHPGADLIVVEKEDSLGVHQTGHNSGVIHAGVYYRPGSLKAELCRKGSAATKAFCEQYGISYKTPGKLIVATDEQEAVRLRALQVNAEKNGITVSWLSNQELVEREPAVAGREALLVVDSGIVDFQAISRALGRQLAEMGATFALNEEVLDMGEDTAGVQVMTSTQTIRARYAVTCGGLQADRLARMTVPKIGFRIVPFRGEYYMAPREKAATFSHMIYPVPDPSLPFLGVHFTPTIDGDLTIGPNAVPGFARESYKKFAVSARDLVDNFRYSGFWRLAASHWRFGLEEYRDSVWKPAYLAKCQRYWPELEMKDLLPATAGIRAQAVSEDGSMIDDFHFTRSKRVLHTCNAPSPAATSALPIGQMIAEELQSMSDVR